jgi:hypothetical protein
MRFLYQQRASAVEFIRGSGPVSAAMKSALHSFRRPAGRAARVTPLRQRAHPTKDFPAFGEVIAEIGVILAIHLGVALAVTLALRMSGII